MELISSRQGSWMNARVKRAAVAAAFAALLSVGEPFALAGPGGSSGPSVRTATEEYSGGQAFLIGYEPTPVAYVGDCDPATDTGCVRFSLSKKDRFFTLKVNDQSGLPVYAAVFAPDGSEIGEVCGETDKPIASPGGFIDVWLTYGNCYGSLSPSLPTVGTVEASFSRSRSAL